MKDKILIGSTCDDTVFGGSHLPKRIKTKQSDCVTVGNPKMVGGTVTYTGQPEVEKGMNWTGYFDKNGVKIYEGDFLKYSPCFIDLGKESFKIHDILIAKVVWNKEEAKFESHSDFGISDLMTNGIVIKPKKKEGK